MNKKNLATMYGVGLTRKAPGTAGSFVAMLLAAPLFFLPLNLIAYAFPIMFAGAVFATVLGTQSTNRYMADAQTAHDPKEVVIDEFAGQWLTYSLLPVIFLIRHADNPQAALALGIFSVPAIAFAHLLIGFLLFRFFDILKPWPISLADRKVKGGFGVMLDDLLAAIPAALLLHVADGMAFGAILGVPA